MRTGRRWVENAAVRQDGSSLKLKGIIGKPCTGRQGLGATHFHQWRKGSMEQRREMVQVEVWHQRGEAQKAKVVELATQGIWTKWDLPERKVWWAKLRRLEPFRIFRLADNVRRSVITCKFGSMGRRGRTQFANCVGRKAHLPVPWLGATWPTPRAGTGGSTIRCSRFWQKS